MSELTDRRQRARETGLDLVTAGGFSPGVLTSAGIEAAIETATRVRITPEIMNAAKPTVPWLTEKDRLTAAFRAAGFEVEQ